MLQEAFTHGKGPPQSMSFLLDYCNIEPARKLKAMKRVTRTRLVLECPSIIDGAATLQRGCCARRVPEAEWDFRDQKGRLQEEVEALDQYSFLSRVSLQAQFRRALLGVEQGGLQEKTAGMALKLLRRWCLHLRYVQVGTACH